MNVWLLIAVLALIGGINPRREDKWNDGWGKYFAGWWQRFLGLTVLFGLINWLGKTQLNSAWHIFEHVSVNLGLMFLVNGIVSWNSQETDKEEEVKERGCYDAYDYSDCPAGMTVIGGLILLLFTMAWFGHGFEIWFI